MSLVVLRFIGFILLIFFVVMAIGFFVTKNKKYLSLLKSVFSYVLYLALILIPLGLTLKYLHL